MIRINLIPEPVALTNRRVVITELAVFGAIIAIAYLAPGLYAESLISEANSISNETAQKQSQIEQLKVDGNTINEYKATTSDLQNRSNKIRSLTIGRKQPVYLLDKLQQQHPERLWLKTIRLDGNQLTITGYAAETYLISDYAARLKSLNENNAESAIDVESFTPPFAQHLNYFSEGETIAKASAYESTVPLKLSDLIIKNFSLDQESAYKFEIVAQVTMPGGS